MSRLQIRVWSTESGRDDDDNDGNDLAAAAYLCRRRANITTRQPDVACLVDREFQSRLGSCSSCKHRVVKESPSVTAASSARIAESESSEWEVILLPV